MKPKATNNTDTMTAEEFRRMIRTGMTAEEFRRKMRTGARPVEAPVPSENRKVRNAVKTEADGVVFDSRLERYMHDLLKSHGIGFMFQKRYTLQEPFTYNGETIRAITYTLDFYLPDYDMAIDTKGVATQRGQAPHQDVEAPICRPWPHHHHRATSNERRMRRACGSADRKPINKSYDPISLHRPLLRCRWYQHGR